MWVTAAVSNELQEGRPHANCLSDAQLSRTCRCHCEMGCLLVLDLLFGREKKNIFYAENPYVSAAVESNFRYDLRGFK